MIPRYILRRYLFFTLLAIGFLFVLVFISPDFRSVSTRRENLVLITIDTLRADKLGTYGCPVRTPSIDSLAASGIQFDRAFCQVPITLPYHATILTGTYPYEHGIRHTRNFRLMPAAFTIA